MKYFEKKVVQQARVIFTIIMIHFPVEAGRNLNVHKILNLLPVFTGFKYQVNVTGTVCVVRCNVRKKLARLIVV